MWGAHDWDDNECSLIVQLADAILSCFSEEKDIPTRPPIQRSEEVGTEFYIARHAVPTNTGSESEDEVYKHLKIASELKKTKSFKRDSCHVVREIACAEVFRNEPIVLQPTSRAATAVAPDRVTDASKGAIPKRVTEGKGKGKGKKTKPVSQVKKADSQFTADIHEIRQAVAAQEEPQLGPSRPNTAEPKPTRNYQQTDSQVTADIHEISQTVAAHEEPQLGPSRPKTAEPKPRRNYQQTDSQVTAGIHEISQAVAAQEEPQVGPSRPKTAEPKPRRNYQQTDSQVTADIHEISQAVAAQEEPQPDPSRPKTAEPKPIQNYQQTDSQVTTDIHEIRQAVAAQEEPHQGLSRPKTAEPKPSRNYQQTDSQVTTDIHEIVLQPTSRAATAVAPDRVTDASKGAIPKRVTEGKGKGKGKKTKPVSQVKKADSQFTADIHELRQAVAAQEEPKLGPSRPSTAEPKPRRNYQLTDSQVTADIHEISQAVAAQEEPQLGPSRPKTAEPKLRLYCQPTDSQVTAYIHEISQAVAAQEEPQPGPSRPQTAEPKPWLNYQQTSFIQTDEFKPAPSVQKITPKNCPARVLYRLLADAVKERSSGTNWRDIYIDALYQKFLDERYGALNDPPSPAPFDPNDLKQVYGDRFDGFIPFYSGQFKSSTSRRVSLPDIEYRYRPSEYTDNLLPDEYGRSEQRHRLARPRSNSEAAETYCRRLYEKLRHRPKVYETRTIWSPEPQGNISDNELIHEDVLEYRRRSSQTFLRLSPEFPEDPKYFKETLYYRRPSLSASPLRQPEDSDVEESDVEDPDVDTARHHRSSDRRRKKMGRMNTVDERERTIIIEFCHLLEKSKQLFNGLRELPQYGHKQWHAYFAKTFDVYSKLWKFQQQHRAILDSKYGLKRWQIGEIASKIGQLYYHFYLRTSDTGYLNEAFSFYYAIRGRCYYTQACREDKSELIVKKLRYYARFIVASLLLKKTKLVKGLLQELDRQITEYGNAYDPEDQNEWRIVADEVRSFIKVETVVEVVHTREFTCFLSHRLGAPISPPTASALDRASSPLTLTLREALIIGSNSTQLKFSELTMDMYRIMQTLEREPNTDVNHLYDESPRQRNPPTPSAINNKGYNADSTNNTADAPHKQMLFKPSPNQIFLYLSSAIDDLPLNGVVLLYVSAEGLIVPNPKHLEEAGGYDVGGLITTSKTDVLTSSSKEPKGQAPKLKEAPVLHPGDLHPFTRRPMFIIVDSDNSFIFHSLPRIFGQPMIILMSPIELPATLYPHNEDQRMEGSLFTLFLHDPLSAVCLCCDVKRMTLEEWQRCQATIDSYLSEAGILLQRMRENTYVQFLGDDFLRLLILRYIFCETILRMHRKFRGRAQRPRCSPTLPDDLFEHPMLTRIVMELAAQLQIRGHFHDPAAAQRE